MVSGSPALDEVQKVGPREEGAVARYPSRNALSRSRRCCGSIVFDKPSILQGIKTGADQQVLQNTRLLGHESYLSRMMAPLVIEQFKTKNKIDLNSATTDYINKLVVNEYINDFNGRVA